MVLTSRFALATTTANNGYVEQLKIGFPNPIDKLSPKTVSNPKRGSESLKLDAGALGELAFDWANDRYQHRWTFRDDDRSASIESVESDNTQLWPVSPPLQQIHTQSFDDGREVVFGVGMAGRGHWSASFTLVPELKCWIIELACRSPLEPERLMSSYKIEDDSREGSSKILLGARKIELEAISPSTIMEAAPRAVQFRPMEINGSATTQWAFRLRVTS